MSERYEIKGKLARGGIGAIYLAHDNSLDREVAIKRLLPLEETKLNEAADESLSREASALAKFTHPNVVTIYSFEEDEDGPFVVTELIDGENLKETTERGALTIEDFKNLVDQTLDPLITAKEMNLLHRDIKPANIMLTILASGRFQIKILDFGLAKFSHTPSTQTLDQRGSFLGSIEYLAPEQLELRPLDQRTDLYSLGCVYYYTLTQASPFEGKNAAETMNNHLEHRVADIREHRDDLSDELAAWLMRLISRQPDDRPDDARVALAEFVAANKGVMPPGGTHSITPVPVVMATPISEPVAFVDASPLRVHTSSQSLSSHTGPMGETTGQRLLKQKQAELAAARSQSRSKLPLIGLIAVVAIVGGLFLFSGSDDPETAPREAPAKADPAVANSREPAKPPPPPSGPQPGFRPLPKIAPGVIASLAPPVTENLAAHYYAGLATYGSDFKTEAQIGEPVYMWGNLAPKALPLNYLSLPTNPNTPISPPRRTSIAPDRFPGTDRVHPALSFSNRNALVTKNNHALKNLEGSSCHVFFVGVVKKTTNSPLLTFTEKGDYNTGLFLVANQTGVRAIRRSQTVGDYITQIESEPGQLALYSYWIDFETGRQSFRMTTPDGQRVGEITDGLSIEPTQLANYRIGGINPSGSAQSELMMIEVLAYNRQLDEVETQTVEQSLADRYFADGTNRAATRTQAPSPPRESYALPIQRKLVAHFDASVGVMSGDAPASKGSVVTRWMNQAPNSEKAPFFLSANSPQTSPIFQQVKPSPSNDPFPTIQFSEGHELRLGTPASSLSKQFTTNDLTILMLLRMPAPIRGLVTRVDGNDTNGLVAFFREEKGASIGSAVNPQGKKDWKRNQIPLESNQWLLWSLSFIDDENRLKSDLSFPTGGWSQVLSKGVGEMPTAITTLQLGVRRSKTANMTRFEIAQYAAYNAILTKEETQAVFQQWRNRYFKAE